MAEIQIHLRKKDAGARGSWVELLFFLAGVLGLVSLLRGVRGLFFSLWAVCLAAAFLCGGLWYSRRKGPKVTAAVWGGLLLLCTAGAFFFRGRLLVQLRCLSEAFSSGPAPASMDATGAVLLLTVGAAALLFAGECLLHCHWPFAALASLLPLFWVLAGFRVSLWALAFLALFAGGFWAARGQRGSLLPRGGAFAVLLIFAALVLTWPMAARFSRELSLPAYRAEELAYRAWQGFSGTAQDAYIGGEVSRGNHYQTGAVRLELTASRRPADSIYLRGFSGEDYVQGRWLPAKEEAVLEKVKTVVNWGIWAYMVDGIYRTMYYILNQYVLREQPPEPLSLTIHYSEENPIDNFSLYCSCLQSYGRRGYTYQFYEARDILLDWERVPESFFTQRDWSRQIHEAYAREAALAYTQVPEEYLPRLTQLAAEHPHSGIDEVTAFILETLKENATYSQTPGWTPVGEEVVEDFLFERHSGYCVHYASAATLLYRLYGIPARYAAGYLIPPEEFSPGESEGWEAAVTDEFAHAWVEIFLPDCGWMPVEVTPNSQGEIAARYPGFAWSTADWRPEEGVADIPVFTPQQNRPSPVQNRAPVGSGSSKRGEPWALCLYIAGCSAVFCFLLLCARREEILRRQNTQGCRETFGRLLELFRFCGVLADCDGMEPDFPQRVAREVPLISPPEWETVLQYAAVAAYGQVAPGPAADAFVREVYRRSARFLVLQLPWYKKLLFRLWKAFL